MREVNKDTKNQTEIDGSNVDCIWKKLNDTG